MGLKFLSPLLFELLHDIFVLTTILSLSLVKTTFVSIILCGRAPMKLGMLAEDMLSMLDTPLNKSLNVLSLVTPKSIPIHPSIDILLDQVDRFVLGQGPIVFNAEISPFIDIVHHGITLFGLCICQIGYCATLFRALRTAPGRWDAEEGHGDPSQACICLMPADSAV
jgi:hypothetical protein